MTKSTREELGEQARTALLAEALGDLKDLSDLVAGLDQQMKTYIKLFELNESKAWVAIVDSKMQEFRHFQIPEIAAAKLQMHSETFLRGIMSEAKHLINLEVERQSRKQGFIKAGAIFLAGFSTAALLAFLLK
jgi:hypothetical protein